eukprot:TRINITY_DN6803_c0_g1_i2.p1 TRINITY_DN6803_c0_g1~~TRINITY_DN6803_c0_g1_i2.p1  ORF type:complete len:151 (+),score=17.39 TRINITY_DN6803_c0_g1_i2:65-454(+)
MSSLLISHGKVLATAMAIAGTVILVLVNRQRPLFDTRFAAVDPNTMSKPQNLRPCLSSDEKKREKTKKKKKRVHFAEEVVEPIRDDEVFISRDLNLTVEFERVRLMPENRVALYNGILKDRYRRMVCSY